MVNNDKLFVAPLNHEEFAVLVAFWHDLALDFYDAMDNVSFLEHGELVVKKGAVYEGKQVFEEEWFRQLARNINDVVAPYFSEFIASLDSF